TVEMGGDIALFELAMRIPPWERLRALSQSELRRMGLLTVETADVRTSGVVGPARPEKRVIAAVHERGWTAVEDGDRRELLRRHPLTIEGEEIGQFALNLTCAGKGAYKLGYLESRARNPEERDARLQSVILRLGGQ